MAMSDELLCSSREATPAVPPASAGQAERAWWALPSAPANCVRFLVRQTRDEVTVASPVKVSAAVPSAGTEQARRVWWALPSAHANCVRLPADGVAVAGQAEVSAAAPTAETEQARKVWWALPSAHANCVRLPADGVAVAGQAEEERGIEEESAEPFPSPLPPPGEDVVPQPTPETEDEQGIEEDIEPLPVPLQLPEDDPACIKYALTMGAVVGKEESLPNLDVDLAATVKTIPSLLPPPVLAPPEENMLAVEPPTRNLSRPRGTQRSPRQQPIPGQTRLRLPSPVNSKLKKRSATPSATIEDHPAEQRKRMLKAEPRCAFGKAARWPLAREAMQGSPPPQRAASPQSSEHSARTCRMATPSAAPALALSEKLCLEKRMPDLDHLCRPTAASRRWGAGATAELTPSQTAPKAVPRAGGWR